MSHKVIKLPWAVTSFATDDLSVQLTRTQVVKTKQRDHDCWSLFTRCLIPHRLAQVATRQSGIALPANQAREKAGQTTAVSRPEHTQRAASLARRDFKCVVVTATCQSQSWPMWFKCTLLDKIRYSPQRQCHGVLVHPLVSQSAREKVVELDLPPRSVSSCRGAKGLFMTTLWDNRLQWF